jgi:hypothetical protein
MAFFLTEGDQLLEKEPLSRNLVNRHSDFRSISLPVLRPDIFLQLKKNGFPNMLKNDVQQNERIS